MPKIPLYRTIARSKSLNLKLNRYLLVEDGAFIFKSMIGVVKKKKYVYIDIKFKNLACVQRDSSKCSSIVNTHMRSRS